MHDLVVLGSLNMDLVVRTASIPRPGETVHGHSFRTVPGGKGANQAAAAARLGASTAMVGRVGDDEFGSSLLANMRRQGVDTEYVRIDDGAASGTALIAVDDQGENSIIVSPGANGRVGREDVDAAGPLLEEARYLVMQFEVPLLAVQYAIEVARELDLEVILNPAPAYPVNADFLKGVYCLIVNETEAATLSGKDVTDLRTAEGAAKELAGLGVQVVIVTLGAQGALLCEGERAVHVPAHRVEVVDTTAAGDAFVGGLTAALLEGRSLPEATRYATCAGSLATTVMGAQTSLPSKAQVEAFFGEGLA